jgi:hypothetical protein
MLRKTLGSVAGFLALLAAGANAQATLTPSFSAPHRAFVRSEFGGIVSFPDGGTAYEGAYRFGSARLDLGLRGGLLDPVGPAGSWMLAGFEGRARMITHGRDFPLDGSLVFGAGGRFRSGQSRFSFPFGLSLGRRVNIEQSRASLTPYVQPTVFLRGGNNVDTDVIFTMGIGANLRLSGTFDTRLSVGLGDVRGVSLGAVWVH